MNPDLKRWADVPPPADVNAIGNLLQAYALLSDLGRTDELAELFTDDATWDGIGHGFGRAEGPRAIAELVCRHFDPDRPMVHLPNPPLLMEVGPNEVHGITGCLATRSPSGPVIYFHYEDVFRRDGDRWRFASRLLQFRFR